MLVKTARSSALPLAAALAAMIGSAHAETTLRLSTGVDYSSGKYGGTSKTDVIVAPLSAKVASGHWALRATVPVISITGNQAFVVIDDNGGAGGGASGSNGTSGSQNVSSQTVTRRGTTTGFGDLSLAGTYTFDDVLGKRSYLDVTGRVRLPTGQESKGLSLGVTDYAAIGELGFTGKNAGSYVSGGRRFLTDAKGLDRVDGWQAEVGGWARTGGRSVVGGSVDWRDGSTRNGRDVADANAYVSFKLNDHVRAGLSASAGLTKAAADYGIGVNLAWKTSFGSK